MADRQFYEFGPFRIDAGRSRLEHGDQVVPVPPRAFDLLLLLVQQPGRVLSKSELMQALWPEVFIEEANLSQHVFTLRKALGVQASGQPSAWPASSRAPPPPSRALRRRPRPGPSKCCDSCSSARACASRWVEGSRGNGEAAIALCETSRDRAPDRVSRAYATMLLGFATLEHGDARRARLLLEPVAEELEEFGFPQWHGWARAQAAEALRMEGRFEEALAAARRGLEIASQARYWYAAGFARRVIGRIAIDAGRLGEADVELGEARGTFERIGAAFEAGRTRLDIARVAQALADTARARHEVCAARRAFDPLDAPLYQARAAAMAAQIG